MADVERQPQHRNQDEDESKSQTFAAKVTLCHGILACLQIFCGNLKTFLDVVIDKVFAKTVNGDARFGQGIPRLIFVQAMARSFPA